MKDTPMIAQYKKIKAAHKDKILFFRLGDFYEMFLDDAIIAACDLEITLTSREAGKGKRIPMCGIPYHAADAYIVKLLDKGHKIAICEQTEIATQGQGLVKREVVRVITPGTFHDPQVLEAKKNNYLLALFRDVSKYGLAFIDVSTGEFHLTETERNEEGEAFLRSEIVRLQPSECLHLSYDEMLAEFVYKLKSAAPMFVSTLKEDLGTVAAEFEKYCTESGIIIEANKSHPGYMAAAMIVFYIRSVQKVDLNNIERIKSYYINEYMMIDEVTRRNLELTRAIRSERKETNLLGVLDYTCTAMGGRMIRKWIEQPLVDAGKIKERNEAVDIFINNRIISAVLQEKLKRVYDLERLMGKVVYGTANAKDMLALKKSLGELPEIKDCKEMGNIGGRLKVLLDGIDCCRDVFNLLDKAIAEDPPAGIKDGDVIKNGYDSEIDRLRNIARQGKYWLTKLESEEKERTGIKNLKIGYNKVFGYYLEVSKSNIKNVPENYIRKQTLVNGERYITPELKDREIEINSARDKMLELEYELFTKIRQQVESEIKRIQSTARIIAEIDTLFSLAEAALYNNYVQPEVTDDEELKILAGRHPVVEIIQGHIPFVPNDAFLDNKENQLLLLTGPNMAGKSTYIRQVAVIVIMAQMGSFVPAKSAKLGIIDRIFTRVGASDDLAGGSSTFMVEMNEVANILSNATRKSLIVLDEIGRGTSTYDGLSIARAVAEYIADQSILGAKTLFATHYHELTKLVDYHTNIKNYTILVEEKGKSINFLRKIVPGASDRSYGIHVARLAKLPEVVITRAEDILYDLENNSSEKRSEKGNNGVTNKAQIVHPEGDYALGKRIIRDITELDIDNITPMEALIKLHQIKKFLQENKVIKDGGDNY